MVAKILRNVINSNEKKRLAKNILSLGVLQGATYLLPLLTIPYLVRVLGPEYFGLIAFASAAISYFMLLTDYGFNLSATQQISVHRDNKRKINEIFCAVMIVKFFLIIISFSLLIILVLSFEKFYKHWDLYLITFGSVVGQALFPVWLFQGMERMRYIAFLTIASKVFFTICIFMFVRNGEDFILVPLLTTLGGVLSGALSIYVARKEFNIHFQWQPKKAIKLQITEGWHVFYSSIAISLYTTSIPFMLGLLTNNSVLGFFTAADKVVASVKGLYTPISQSIYPLIGKKINDNKYFALKFINKIAWIVGICMLIVSILLLIFSAPIIDLLFGPQYERSIILLKIMALSPFLVVLSNIYGIQAMLNLGYKKEFSYFVMITAILGLLLAFLFIYFFGAIGAALTALIVEFIITLMLVLFVWIKKRRGNL